MPPTQSTPLRTDALRQYLYGIGRADLELPAELPGVGDTTPEVVVSGPLAAIVSGLPAGADPGTPEDLVAHSEVLDAVAAAQPVLPAQFGTVAEDPAELADQLLSRPDELLKTLDELEGAAQFTLRVVYERDAVLAAMLTEDPELAQLRERIAGTTEDETRTERIQLGEAIVQRFEAMRPADAQAVLETAEPHVRGTVIHETGRADDVVSAAFLVEHSQAGQLESALEGLARQQAERMRFRLLGPQAAYDFVEASR